MQPWQQAAALNARLADTTDVHAAARANGRDPPESRRQPPDGRLDLARPTQLPAQPTKNRRQGDNLWTF